MPGCLKSRLFFGGPTQASIAKQLKWFSKGPGYQLRTVQVDLTQTFVALLRSQKTGFRVGFRVLGLGVQGL